MMDISGMIYTKGESKHPLRPKKLVRSALPLQTNASETGYNQNLSSDYQKFDGILSPNLIFVLSGGENKERDFLKELIEKKNIRSLRVIFMSKERQGLQPYQMQEKWADIRQIGKLQVETRTYQLDELDKVFLLTDVDEYYDQLVRIRSDKSADGQGQWIISNPCFEIWLYYCYADDPERDLTNLVPLGVDKRSQTLKTMGNEIIKGGLNPCVAFENMSDGIVHSKAHFGLDEYDIPVLFATEMHEMAQYMVDTMSKAADEYMKFVKKKAEWRDKMRQL